MRLSNYVYHVYHVFIMCLSCVYHVFIMCSSFVHHIFITWLSCVITFYHQWINSSSPIAIVLCLCFTTRNWHFADRRRYGLDKWFTGNMCFSHPVGIGGILWFSENSTWPLHAFWRFPARHGGSPFLILHVQRMFHEINQPSYCGSPMTLEIPAPFGRSCTTPGSFPGSQARESP